ncbi:unnamed protein product [Heterobilharzia americana]|nr:unnamed protein product [Heterobilharzia americana]
MLSTEAISKIERSNGLSKKLFLHTDIIYHPESDPLEHFPTDQINRLNPRILVEISRLQALDIKVEGNSHPPSINDMENYATCLDAGEWNTSCHLKLIYTDKKSYLPCQLSDLYIRLSPDYIHAGQLNWYYLPKLKYLSLLSDSIKDTNKLKNTERYLDIYYDELNNQFERLRKLIDHRRSLISIGKMWIGIICASMARLYNFDHNLLTIASIKSTQETSQLAF